MYLKYNRMLLPSLVISFFSILISCEEPDEICCDIIEDTTILPQTDPQLAATIGFFNDNWQPKSFVWPGSFSNVTPPAAASVTINIDRSKVMTKVPSGIYGHNANVWMTQIVTEPVLMDHLSNLKPNLIRFPGGSLSDVFFWNAQPDKFPADAPANLIGADGVSKPAGYWSGNNTASWTITVDNYYNLLQQTGNKGMITVNYGYARYGTGANPVAAAAHMAAEWVRYDKGRTQYWEVGNENFGDWEAGYRIVVANNKDGQPEYASGQLYGQHFKVFADSMKKAAAEIGKTIYIGAVISESSPLSWWTSTAKNWNAGVFSASGAAPDFYVVHNYYTNYQTNASAAEILATPEVVTKTMMDYVKSSIAASSVSQKPVVLDEWNIFSSGSKQAVSHVNGLHATMVLGEALKNNFGMTARWDLSNGWSNGDDHGLFNSGDEPDGVPKWNARPAFYHMYYFQQFMGDRLVTSTSSSTEVVCYASSFSSGEMGVILVNKAEVSKPVEIKISNFRAGSKYSWYTLTGGLGEGEFSRKVFVNNNGPSIVSGGPNNYKTIAANSATTTNGVRVMMPGRSAIYLVVAGK